METTKKVDISGVSIDNISFGEAIEIIELLIKRGKGSYIVTPNVDHIVKLQKDIEFKQIYEEATLVLADGTPILWTAKLLGTPIKEKISGSDLFPKLCEIAAVKGYRLFFLGGREGAALKSAEILKYKYPNIQIVGVYSPPFGFENDKQENEKIAKMIKNRKPDILFVGLGAPKQEKWIYKNKDEYQAPVSIGIGVSFEFMSGMLKRAPKWMQYSGLEWFWRFVMEPKRLWKRYLVDDLRFFLIVIKQRLKTLV